MVCISIGAKLSSIMFPLEIERRYLWFRVSGLKDQGFRDLGKRELRFRALGLYGFRDDLYNLTDSKKIKLYNKQKYQSQKTILSFNLNSHIKKKIYNLKKMPNYQSYNKNKNLKKIKYIKKIRETCDSCHLTINLSTRGDPSPPLLIHFWGP